MHGFRHWRWHVDEAYVRINGETHYLWRAVDHEGEVLESFVTKKRDKSAALLFMKKALKRHGKPKKIGTDGLRSYPAAMRNLGNLDCREMGRWLNNRVENSHLPFRRREWTMLRFRQMKSLQKFALAHASLHNHFTGIGDLHFYGIATHTIELSLPSLPGEPAIDRSGYFDGPLKWRANLGVDWTQGSWSVGWNTQFYGSYRVCQSVLTDFTCSQEETWQGSSKIRGQNYSDIYASYDFKSGGVLEGTNLRIGIQNIFNQKPPAVASGVDQTGYSSFADPRLQRFTLTLRKHF